MSQTVATSKIRDDEHDDDDDDDECKVNEICNKKKAHIYLFVILTTFRQKKYDRKKERI